MNGRRPIVPTGPAVDPWEGHPLFPRHERYGVANWRMPLTEFERRVGVVPVIPGPVGGSLPGWADLLC